MNEINDEVEALADGANALLDSSLSAVGKRYDEAREALDAVLKRGKSIYGVARERAVNDTKLVDRAIHDHLYQTIAISIGIGVFLGYVLSRPRD